MLFVKDGKTEYSILIAKDASESIMLSAQSLQDLIKRCTGADLEICTEAKPPFVSIGETTEFQKLGVVLDANSLRDDGFKILFREGNIFLCGAKERATVYASYEFAERYLGVRFLTATEDYTPFSARVEIPEEDVTEIPDFDMRCFYTLNVKNPRLQSRMRLVSQYTPAGSEKYGGGFLRDWNGYEMHAMLKYLPKSKYYETHPEWYAGTMGRSWLCLTNGLTDEDEDDFNPESCLSAFTNNLIEDIKAHPTQKYIMIGHEDASSYAHCQCERCKRSRERNVTVSGYLMVWVNAVARRVEKWRKENCPEREIKLVSFSYLDTVIPPVYVENEDGINKPYIFLEREYWAPLKVRKGKIIPVNPKVVPEKNVVIFCAPLGLCYLHGPTEEICDWNQYFQFSIKAWSELGADVMVWSYGVNFKCHLWWFPNRRTMPEFMRFFAQFRTRFMMQQGAPGEGGFYQVILNTYLLSKLMWNVNRNVDELTEEFNRAYFGEEFAPVVNETIRKIEDRFEELKKQYNGAYHSDIQDHFPNSFLPENFPYEWLTGIIDELDRAIEKADGEVKTKLKRVALHPLYMLAYNIGKYENADTMYLDKLEKYLLDTGVRNVSEGATTPEALMAKLRGKLQQ